MKEINLEYNLSKKLAGKLHLRGAKLFVQARNLGLIYCANIMGMILNGYLEVINHLQQLPLALILIFNLKIMKQIIYVFLLTVLSSCDSYLSKVPSPSTSAPINNVEQLVAIYDNATALLMKPIPLLVIPMMMPT